MFVLCKASARLCKVFYCMAPLKYFSSFNGMILLLLIGGVIGGRTRSIGNLELEKLNTAIKTVQSEDGDIIDCVDIQMQPALSHPLLKNHSIQMRPSFYQRELKSDLSSKPRRVKQIWQKSGSCPVGTIPILRNLKGGSSKTFPFPRYGGEVANNGPEDALAYCSQGAPYYGTSAILNNWSVYVEPNEYSVNFAEILNKDVSNFAGVGWGVYPNLFGDNRTRLFNYWADSKTNRGCFDLSCAGFVQVNRKIVLGGTLGPLSTYDGDQYEFDTHIIKEDIPQSSWWLFVLGQKVGYWPVSIFSDLNEASHLVWGGAVYNGHTNGQHTSTQLGSGHFAQEGFGKAAYMYGVQAMNSTREFVTPDGIRFGVDKPGCYNFAWATDLGSTPGASFYYGGPGGSGCA